MAHDNLKKINMCGGSIMTIFERKNDQTKLPLIDTELSVSRGLGLAIAGSAIMGLILYLDSLISVENHKLVYFLLLGLIPLILMISALKIITKFNFSSLVVTKYWSKSNFKTGVVYFIGYVLFTQLAQLIMRLANIKVVSHDNVDHITVTTLLFNYGTDLVNLMNEELFSLFVFIGFTIIFQKTFKLSRSTSIYSGLLVSIILFGLIHYNAYNGNLVTMFLLIGPARFFFTGAFIRTKNILVPFTMHYIFDELSFTLIFIVTNI